LNTGRLSGCLRGR